MAIDYQKLLRPDKRVLTVFIVLSVLSFLDIYAFGARFIPCQVKPVVAPDITVYWTDSLCSLRPTLLGVTTRFTELSFLTLVFYILILPYVLSCLIAKYIWKERTIWSGIKRALKIK
jgi:hypothetical protein